MLQEDRAFPVTRCYSIKDASAKPQAWNWPPDGMNVFLNSFICNNGKFAIQFLTTPLSHLILCLCTTDQEYDMEKILTAIGFAFLISGIVGVYMTIGLLQWGSSDWVLVIITCGTLAAAGLGIIIGLILTLD